jgi:hypothetical protein
MEEVMAQGLIDVLCDAGGGGLRHRWSGRLGV